MHVHRTTLLENGANPDSFLTPNESPKPLAEAPLHILCKSLTSNPPLPSGAEIECFTKVNVNSGFGNFGRLDNAQATFLSHASIIR